MSRITRIIKSLWRITPGNPWYWIPLCTHTHLLTMSALNVPSCAARDQNTLITKPLNFHGINFLKIFSFITFKDFDSSVYSKLARPLKTLEICSQTTNCPHSSATVLSWLFATNWSSTSTLVVICENLRNFRKFWPLYSRDIFPVQIA